MANNVRSHIVCNSKLSLSVFLCGKIDESRLNNLCQIVPIINIGNKKVLLCSVIRWTHHNFAQHLLYRLCWLDKQRVIADKTNHHAVAIETVVAHHLPRCNLPRAGTLLHYILHKIFAASHSFQLFYPKVTHNPETKIEKAETFSTCK